MIKKENVFLVVKNVILEILPDVDTNNISIEQNLRALGANSIERTEIVVLAMEQLGIKLPLVSFGSVENIEGMVDVLVENS